MKREIKCALLLILGTSEIAVTQTFEGKLNEFQLMHLIAEKKEAARTTLVKDIPILSAPDKEVSRETQTMEEHCTYTGYCSNAGGGPTYNFYSGQWEYGVGPGVRYSNNCNGHRIVTFERLHMRSSSGKEWSKDIDVTRTGCVPGRPEQKSAQPNAAGGIQ